METRNYFARSWIGPKPEIFNSSPNVFKKSVSLSLDEINEESIVINNEFGKSLQSILNQDEIEMVSNNKFTRVFNKKCKTKISIYDIISKLSIIIHFILKLKETSSIKKPRFLSKLHFNIINDVSFYPKIYINSIKKTLFKSKSESIFENINGKEVIKQKNNKFRNSLNYIFSWWNQKIFQKIPIFDPLKKKTMIYNFLYLFLLTYYFTKVPLSLVFDIKITNSKESYVLEIFISYFLPIILFLSFGLYDSHKAFYKRGNLVYERNIITKRFIKKDLLYDIISILFLISSFLQDVFGAHDNYIMSLVNKFLSLLFYLRIKKFKNLITEVEEYLYLDEAQNNIAELLKIICKTLFILHVLACAWYAIGNNYSEGDKNWINSKNLNHETWISKYIYSYYFIIITINTVGYGDISPTNLLETIFTIFVVFFASIFFAYIINSIGMIISDISKKKKEFKQQINIINGYLRRKKISTSLKRNIRKYLEYIWSEDSMNTGNKEMNIINSLSNSLKERLLLEANGYPLKKNQIFCNNFSEETLRKIVFAMKEERYVPGEIIYQKNEIYDTAFYLVRKGEVGLFIESEKEGNPYRVIEKIGKGFYFGEREFFSGFPRRFGVVSNDYTTVLKIKVSEFLKILESNTEDKERYHTMRNNIRLYKEYTDLNISCFSCKKLGHYIDDCPWIHKNFLKSIIISKFDYSVDQPRKKIVRKSIEKFGKKQTLKINHAAKAYLFDNEIGDTFTIDISSIYSNNENRLSDLDINEHNSPNLENIISISENESIENNLNEQNNFSPQRTNSLDLESRNNGQTPRRRKKKSFDNEKLENTKYSFSEMERNELIFDKVCIYSEFYPRFNIDEIIKRYKLSNYLRKKGSKKKVTELLSNFKSRRTGILSTTDISKKSRKIISEKELFFHRGELKRTSFIYQKINGKIKSSKIIITSFAHRFIVKLKRVWNKFFGERSEKKK